MFPENSFVHQALCARALLLIVWTAVQLPEAHLHVSLFAAREHKGHTRLVALSLANIKVARCTHTPLDSPQRDVVYHVCVCVCVCVYCVVHTRREINGLREFCAQNSRSTHIKPSVGRGATMGAPRIRSKSVLRIWRRVHCKRQREMLADIGKRRG
jgi:hypothetical protein